MISFTMFKNLYDNKTNKFMNLSDFSDFENLLYDLAKKPLKDKKSAQLITPAIFCEGTTRANANVMGWKGWAAVDVDDHVFEGDLKEELHAKYGDYYYICYSTASSTKEHPKFRLVFPLKNSVISEKIKHFWYALNKELGEIGDAQTKDLSRMYFIPGSYEGAHNFIFTNKGEYVDPNLLMRRYDYIQKTGNTFLDSLPEAVKTQILAHRKEQMTNTSISWHNYKDCPFVNKRLVAEYKTISDTGWYRKMYQIMCSMASNAVKQKYPINAMEIAEMCTQIDNETGQWYQNRPLVREATGAIEFAYENVDFR